MFVYVVRSRIVSKHVFCFQVFAFYTVNQFSWSAQQVGLFFTAIYLYNAVAVGGVIPLVNYLFPFSKGYWPPMIVSR